MKNLSVVFCLLFYMGVSSAQEYRNLDFEMRNDSLPDQPAYWSASDGLSIGSSSQDAKGGEYCFSIIGAGDRGRPEFAYQKAVVNFSELKLLEFSAQIKVEESEEGEIVIYASSWNDDLYLGHETSENFAAEPHGEWVKKSFQMWVGKSATEISLGARLTGKGKFYVDDFAVNELTFSNKPMSAEVEAYVDEFLKIVKENSLYKDQLDVQEMRKSIQIVSQGAQEISAIHSALRFVLKSVDKHSMLWPKEQTEKWRAPKTVEKIENVEHIIPAIPVTTGHWIADDIAYLNMPAMGSGNQDELIYFADTLQQLIKSLDKPTLKGWVLDLRNNDGGNCWPMLAGIGPILGEGVCGYFALDDNYDAWEYENGESRLYGNTQTAVSGKPYIPFKKNPKVAVLIGENTSSSGEVCTVAFSSRSNAKSFGEFTSGYSTTNTNFNLSDGSMLLLAVSVYADRAKQKFGEKIKPDVLVQEVTGSDEPLKKAVEWLRQ